MAIQASGSSGLVAWKPEKTYGMPDFSTVSGGGSTTLTVPAVPGATTLDVADATNITADDVLKVGGLGGNPEYVQVESIASLQITLYAATPVNYRHEAGEAVVEVAPAGMRKLGAVVSFNPGGELGDLPSQAIHGERTVVSSRVGNYSLSGSMTVEAGIEEIGFLLLHAMGSGYATTGTDPFVPAASTVDSAHLAGDITLDVASAAGLVPGDYYEVGTGDGAEVVLIDSISVDTLTLDADTPLRMAHAADEATKLVVAPFTHTIKRGSLPPGLTMLLHLTDIDSLSLYRGVKIDSMSVRVDPGALPTVTINFVGQGGQTLEKNIFGTPATATHEPYAPHEALVFEGGAQRRVEQISLDIANNINAGAFDVGSQFVGQATEGAGEATGSFTYKYTDASLVRKTSTGAESSLKLQFTYKGDTAHRLEFFAPRVKFSGVTHPGLTGKDPVADTKNFRSLKDATEGTDIKITYRTNEVTLQ